MGKGRNHRWRSHKTPIQIHEAESAFKLLPLYARLEDGLERLFDIVKSNVFRFYVNGKVFESTIAEAVLLSLTIYESLQSDRIFDRFESHTMRLI
jgi:hypothetical protein